MLWPIERRTGTTPSAGEVRLLVESALTMGLFRIALLLLSFRRLASWGTENRGTAIDSVGPAQVAWAIRVMASRTPWKNTCLVQGLAAAAMLRRRGLGFTLHLGVNKHGPSLSAHAWLSSGDLILTGNKGSERFFTISTFEVGSEIAVTNQSSPCR